jgi:hypothetical protein
VCWRTDPSQERRVVYSNANRRQVGNGESDMLETVVVVLLLLVVTVVTLLIRVIQVQRI